MCAAISDFIAVSQFELSQQYDDIPGIYARNLLIKYGLITYDEPVYPPQFFKRSRIWDKPGHAIPPKVSHLKVFPNPAGTYVIAEYDLGGLEPPFSIALTNLQGIDLKTIPLKDRLNQVIIPTKKYSPGVYFIRLLAGKGLIDSKKITIIR